MFTEGLVRGFCVVEEVIEAVEGAGYLVGLRKALYTFWRHGRSLVLHNKPSLAQIFRKW